MRWIFPPEADDTACTALAAQFGLRRPLAEILCRRGFAEHQSAADFLEPRLKRLSDPFLLGGMEAAVERLLQAIDALERIALYGDYDVDGVTSLAIFSRVLQAYGAEVACFLPLRMDEGYGLTREGIARCRETIAPQLLIAIDCGTSSVAEISELRASGVDVIVIDHHEPKAETPVCAALVNPKLGHEHQYLCSAGLVFKVAHAMLKRRPLAGFDLREYLDLVALGTVADVAALSGENRILVRSGLLQLAKTRWPGLQALAQTAGIQPPYRPMDIGFKLGPRLNAAGRLDTAQASLDLLLAADLPSARPLAEQLDLQNRERREVEDGVLAAAEEQLARCYDPERDAAIVVGGRGWHPGVVGIVAARLVRRYYRPAIVIGFDENGVGKGSARSIAGLSIVAALASCAEHLTRHGGHEMAAGLSLREENLEAFRRALSTCARAQLSQEQLTPVLAIDACLPLREIDLDFLHQHDSLQPFGTGNFQPLLCARGVHARGEPRRLKEKHLYLLLTDGAASIRSIWFGAPEGPLPPPPWDVVFEVERQEWEGRISVQLIIRALRSSQGS